MGFFNKVFSNPITGALGGSVLGPVGMVGGALLGKKNQTNAELNAQMVPGGSPPAMLDPNDMGKPNVGGSPYAQMQRAMGAKDAMWGADMANGQAAGQTANASAQMAQRGGLSSGAYERIQRDGMADAANSNQLNAQQMQQGNLQTGIADEQNRSNIYQNIRQQNQNMQGQVYAGNQMSNATINANRPKGLLGMGFLGL